MSERIKELWEKATFSQWPRPGKFTAGEYSHHLEKFAELIVLEYAGILGQDERNMLEHLGIKDGT